VREPEVGESREVQESGLAGTVWSDESDHATFGKFESAVVECGLAAVALGKYLGG
jgi:hypothetical protein